MNRSGAYDPAPTLVALGGVVLTVALITALLAILELRRPDLVYRVNRNAARVAKLCGVITGGTLAIALVEVSAGPTGVPVVFTAFVNLVALLAVPGVLLLLLLGGFWLAHLVVRPPVQVAARVLAEASTWGRAAVDQRRLEPELPPLEEPDYRVVPRVQDAVWSGRRHWVFMLTEGSVLSACYFGSIFAVGTVVLLASNVRIGRPLEAWLFGTCIFAGLTIGCFALAWWAFRSVRRQVDLPVIWVTARHVGFLIKDTRLSVTDWRQVGYPWRRLRAAYAKRGLLARLLGYGTLQVEVVERSLQGREFTRSLGIRWVRQARQAAARLQYEIEQPSDDGPRFARGDGE